MLKQAVLLSLVLVATSVHAKQDVAPLLQEKVSPHGAVGKCEACHAASADDLEGMFVLPSTKRKLKNGPNGTCTACHRLGLGHGIGKKPEMNRENLPLDKEGTITCAVTCHDIHLKTGTTEKQRHYHLRLEHNRLCTSCHDR